MYHFAFAVGDEQELTRKRTDLEAKGVKVRGIVDHGWCKSIYFRDPNFLQLEFCCLTEEIGKSHRAGRFSEAWTGLARRYRGRDWIRRREGDLRRVGRYHGHHGHRPDHGHCR